MNRLGETIIKTMNLLRYKFLKAINPGLIAQETHNEIERELLALELEIYNSINYYYSQTPMDFNTSEDCFIFFVNALDNGLVTIDGNSSNLGYSIRNAVIEAYRQNDVLQNRITEPTPPTDNTIVFYLLKSLYEIEADFTDKAIVEGGPGDIDIKERAIQYIDNEFSKIDTEITETNPTKYVSSKGFHFSDKSNGINGPWYIVDNNVSTNEKQLSNIQAEILRLKPSNNNVVVSDKQKKLNLSNLLLGLTYTPEGFYKGEEPSKKRPRLNGGKKSKKQQKKYGGKKSKKQRKSRRTKRRH